MASPARRPKQNPSTPLSSPPLPLPGLAIGLFAAIAAGFAASRGLRRKRHAPSPQDQESKVLSAGRDFPPLANGIQMEKDDFRALPSTKEHSTSGNPILEPAKIAASAHVSDVCLNSKNGEEACLSEDGDGKMEEMDEKEEMRIGADTHERITLKIEESVSEPSIEQLLRNGKERYPKAEHLEDDGGTEYEDDRSKEIGHEAQNLEEDNSGYCDEDKHMNDNKGEDGDDQRSSVERDPGHVLLNGRILDFVDDSCNFNDHSEILSNEHNCFADSVSESSLQEVSSAPVKPLPPVEDSGEATWLATKPGFDFTTGVVKELTDLEINFPPTEHNMADSASLSPQIKSGVLVLREEFVNANLILAESMQENEIAEKENRFSNGVVNGSKDNSQALDGGVFVWDFVPDETNPDSGRIERKVHSQDSTLSEDCSKNRTVEYKDHDLSRFGHMATETTSLELPEMGLCNGIDIIDRGPLLEVKTEEKGNSSMNISTKGLVEPLKSIYHSRDGPLIEDGGGEGHLQEFELTSEELGVPLEEFAQSQSRARAVSLISSEISYSSVAREESLSLQDSVRLVIEQSSLSKEAISLLDCTSSPTEAHMSMSDDHSLFVGEFVAFTGYQTTSWDELGSKLREENLDSATTSAEGTFSLEQEPSSGGVAREVVTVQDEMSFEKTSEDELLREPQAVLVHTEVHTANEGEIEAVVATLAVMVHDESRSENKGEDETTVALQAVMDYDKIPSNDIGEDEAVITAQAAMVHDDIRSESKGKDEVIVATQAIVIHDEIPSNGVGEGEAIVAAQKTMLHEDMSSENEVLVATQAVMVHGEIHSSGIGEGEAVNASQTAMVRDTIISEGADKVIVVTQAVVVHDEIPSNDIGEDEAVIAAQSAMVHEDIRFESKGEDELVVATHAVMVLDETVSNGIGEREAVVAAQKTMVDDDISSEREGENVTTQALKIHKIHETLSISIGEGEAVIAAQAAMGPGKMSSERIGEDEVTVLTQAVMVNEQIPSNGIEEGEVVKAAQAVIGPDEISSASKKEDESLVKTQSVMVHERVDCREHEAIVTTQAVIVHEAEIKFEDGVVIATPVATVHDTIRSESNREDEAIVARQAVSIHEDISSENKGEDEAIVATQAVSVHEDIYSPENKGEKEDQNDERMSSELLQGRDEDRSQPIHDNQIPSKTEGENRLAYYVMAKGKDVKEIEEIATSDDVCDLIFESKKVLSRDNTNSNQRRSKEPVVHSDADKTLLQQRGKFLEYLPLEMGLACLLIALVSFVLWYLELLTPVQG